MRNLKKMTCSIEKKYAIVIPARKGSKGIPHKNRKLIEYTLQIIPDRLKSNIIIATDDDFIIDKYGDYDIFKRSDKVSMDHSSTKSLFLEMKDYIKYPNIIMLYLTYPERSLQHILGAIEFYEKNKATSLLCSKKPKTSPFLMMYKDGINGRQIIKHNLYRRQDYPICFEISHFISIFKTKEIDNLNNNMYNKDTIFFPVDDFIDIDTTKDLESFNEKNKNNR